MKRIFKKDRDEYSQLKRNLLLRIFALGAVSIVIINLFYTLAWRGKGAEMVVRILQSVLIMDYESAVSLYRRIFGNYFMAIWMVGTGAVFILLLRIVLRWFTHYFELVSQGIDALLTEDEEICLPPELIAIDRKLNAVKENLKQRTLEAQLSEKRKNDLVMYLAHDIRTPLTSVIGYLNLLEDAPDLSAQQREKYIHITLAKACRLEEMLDEQFEITRFNLQEIEISKQPIDLYYMLVQLTDELSPMLSQHGNSILLEADENITICGDPDKLARVFNNVLKNAAAYSYPNTPIEITAQEQETDVQICFRNWGKLLPKEKLNLIFEKFYRMDESRTSNTGGTGLGLSIAKEIVTLHGGTISANCDGELIEFSIVLPK